MASKDLLKAVRERSGLSTNYKLARKMDVSDQLVSRWERNLGVPDGMSMINLLEVSGLSASEAKEELMKGVSNKEAGFASFGLMLSMFGLSSTALLTHFSMSHYPFEALFGAGLSGFSLYIMLNIKLSQVEKRCPVIVKIIVWLIPTPRQPIIFQRHRGLFLQVSLR